MPEPLLTASAMFANAARFADAYHAALSPLCAETGLQPAAADILLFLANNPGCETAGAICRMRGLKPAIVAFHIDRLVGEGFLQRQPVPSDRRKTALVLTAQAQPIVAEGRELQRAFADRLAEGLSAEDLAHFRRCVAIFDRNIEQIRAEKSKRTEIQNP